VQIVSTFQTKENKRIVNFVSSSHAQKKKEQAKEASHPPNLLLTPLATRPKIPPLFFSFWNWMGTAVAVVTEIKVAAIGGGTV
jgi:hypothetical protein